MIRQLFGHAAAYTFANLFSRGTVLVWLLVLPAFLSAADYGALGLIITTAALVAVVVPLEVSQGLARYYPTAPAELRAQWSRTAWTFTAIMLALAAAAGLAFSGPLNRLLLGGDVYLPAFRIAVAYFALNAGFTFVQSQFRWDFRARDYTVVTLLFAAMTLVLSIGLAAVLPDALTGVLVGLVAGAAMGLALGAWRLRGTIGIGFDRDKLKRMLRFSLPLVPASVALFVSTYASRYMLNGMLSLNEVGLFTWASQLANIPPLLLLGVQAAVTPLVMKHHGDEGTPALLARSFETIVAAELWLCLALALFTPELIRFLGYSSYLPAAPLVMFLAPAFLMMQLYVFAPGFAIGERTDLQLLVSLLAGGAAIALNYVLIDQAGMVGAALATLGSSALFLAVWFMLSHRFYPVPVRWGRLALFTFAAAGLAWLGFEAGAASPALKILVLAMLGGAALILRLLNLGSAMSVLGDFRASLLVQRRE